MKRGITSFIRSVALPSRRSFSTDIPEGKGYIWGAGAGRKMGLKSMVQMRSTAFGFGEESLKPQLVLEGAPIRLMAFGIKHGAIVDGNGDLYTYGENKYHQLGMPGIESVDVPVKVAGIRNVVQVKVGAQHTIALTAKGEVFTWGHGGTYMNPGALGHAGKEDCKVPTFLAGLPDDIVSVAAGAWFNLALTESGEVWAWGRGESGVLGRGSSSDSHVPIRVEALLGHTIDSITCGASFSAAITNEGELWMWGKNDKGQLGQTAGMLQDLYSMEAIPCLVSYFNDEGLTVAAASCGSKHTVACTDDHQLYQWGNAQWLQPNQIRGDDSIILEHPIEQVGAGAHYSAAVDVSGNLWTWGAGESCCLGNGDKETQKSPRLVKGFGPANITGNIFGPVKRLFTGAAKMGVIC